MLIRLQEFFSTPARQAAAWAGLGIAGMVFAALGLMLFLGGDDGGKVRASGEGTPQGPVTGTATSRPSPGPSGTATTASPSVTPSPTPTRAATPTPVRTQAPAQNEPTQEPTPEPTEEVVAGGPYCPSISGQSPPNSVFGKLVLNGTPAPAGTVVTLLFDGVAGPSKATTDAGGYKVNWAAAGQDCANRVGAAISVAVDGTVYPIGQVVGGQGGSPIIVFNIEN